MKLRAIKENDLNMTLFASFRRHQQVKRCWRKEDNKWVLKENAFTEEWGPAEYEQLIGCLKETLASKGMVYGAYEDERLVGFFSVERERLGSNQQYVELTSLHVSEDCRGRGIGRKLFEAALSVAASFNAKKLYISSHSSEETQAFYKAMGCREAEEYRIESVEREPCDCQLECDTGTPASSMNTGISLGICIGTILGIGFGRFIFDNIAMGMGIGMCMGLCFGMCLGGTAAFSKKQGKDPKKDR